jgi:hypothetical protein
MKFKKGDIVKFNNSWTEGIFTVLAVASKSLPPGHSSDYDWDEVKIDGYDHWVFGNSLRHATPIEIAKWKIESATT